MPMPLLVAYMLLWVSRTASFIAQVSLGGFVLGISFLVAVAIYRLYLHPLSRIPGPRLAAITNCWLAYHVRNGHMLQLGKTLHTKYGPAVRIGPNEVWFNTKDAFRLIYSKPPCPAQPSPAQPYLALPCHATLRHDLFVPRPLSPVHPSRHCHKLIFDQVPPMALKSHLFTVRDITSALLPLPPRRRDRGCSF